MDKDIVCADNGESDLWARDIALKGETDARITLIGPRCEDRLMRVAFFTWNLT